MTPTINTEIEVKLQPYPGAQVQWVRAKVLSEVDEYDTFMVQLLKGEYHGSNRMYVKADGGWR